MWASGNEMEAEARKAASEKREGVQKYISKLALKKREEKRRKAATKAA
jgi:hypothetical protein